MVRIERDFKEVMDTIDFNCNSKVNVMVSGGSDSMCLLDCARKYFENKKVDLNVIYIHFEDFESCMLAKLCVTEYCSKHGIKLSIKDSDIKEDSKGKSIKLIARKEMKEYAVENKPDYVLTGHHYDDNIETLVYRFLTGRAGVKGLSCMKTIDLQTYNDVKCMFVKPLLNNRKKDIAEYCIKNSIKYVDDETNFEVNSDRNYIRNVIMPLVRNRFNDRSILNFAIRLEEYINELKKEKLEYVNGYWDYEEFRNASLSCKVDSVLEECRKLGYVLGSFYVNRLKKFLSSEFLLEKKVTGGFSVYENESIVLLLVWGKNSNKVSVRKCHVEN